MSTAVEAKRCKTCGDFKPVDAFSQHPTTRDRRLPSCKSCHAAYMRERRATDGVLAVRGRAQSQAYHAALSVLRERHRVEFDAIYAHELAIRGLTPEGSATDAR